MTPVFGQEQGGVGDLGVCIGCGIGDLGVCIGCGIGDLDVCIGCGGSWSLVSWREKVKRWGGGGGGGIKFRLRHEWIALVDLWGGGKGGKGDLRASVIVVSHGSPVTVSESDRKSYCGRGMALTRDRVARMESR